MKKIVPTLVVALMLVTVGFVFLRGERPHSARGAGIAPPDSLLFAHLPDVPRTMQRWRGTALAQLWGEPEVRAFAAAPLARMPVLLEAQKHLRRLERIGLLEVFGAITSTEGPEAGFVVGLRFAGSKRDVASLMAEPWAEWRRTHASGQTVLLHREGWEIETHGAGDQVLAGCFLEGWYFLSNDLPRLEQTLGRCRDGSTGGLGSTPALIRASLPLPADADAFLYAQPVPLLALLSHLPARSPGTPLQEPDAPARGTVAWAVKLDGARIHDTIFFPGASPAATPLSPRTRALKSEDSLLYSAFALPENLDVPPVLAPLLASLTAAPGLEMVSRTLAASEFAAAFGPECAVAFDWPAEAETPALSFAIAVRDAGRAARVIATLTESDDAEMGWLRSEADGVTLYQAPTDAKTGAAPVIAMLPDFAVLGAHASGVTAAAIRLKAAAGPANLAATLAPATEAVAVLDVGRLFERTYEMFRPFLRMSLAFSPETGPYIDPEKLPSTGVLARHFEETFYTQTAHPDGILVESSGSLSLSQTFAGAAVALGTSVLPGLRKAALPGRNAAETSAKAQKADEKSQIGASQR